MFKLWLGRHRLSNLNELRKKLNIMVVTNMHLFTQTQFGNRMMYTHNYVTSYCVLQIQLNSH